MKRDMDLCREILKAIEDSEKVPLGWINIDIPGHPKESVSYHVMQLEMAGLITAKNLSNMSGFSYAPISLTWTGHEFLDAARNDTIWNQAKDLVIRNAGGLSFELLKVTLTDLGKRALLSAIS